MRFTKMEGIGNDYIYVNCFREKVENPVELSVRMSRYHFGCGSDGLILILPSQIADFRMRMFNNDGSESPMCGNGIRCVARYCRERGLTDRDDFTIESGGQIKRLHCDISDGTVRSVRVDMGEPELDGALIPSLLKGKPVIGQRLSAGKHEYALTLVNMGNPHAVCFVDDPDAVPVCVDGPILEAHEAFPLKTNVEFVRVMDRENLRVRVWERGTGETLACGTGACASMVAACLNGYCGREANVTLPGGTLRILWNESDNHVLMSGPATFVYDGEWLQDV